MYTILIVTIGVEMKLSRTHSLVSEYVSAPHSPLPLEDGVQNHEYTSLPLALAYPPPPPNLVPGGGGRTRRRITDDGDAFEEWSYTKAKPTSRDSDGSALSSDDARSDSAAGRARARAKGSGSARVLREEEDEDEEGGGFLPADDDEDESMVASKAKDSGSSEGGNEGKGKGGAISSTGAVGERFVDWTEEQSDDDAEGGGFIVELDTEKDAAETPARTRPASKGKGKAKAKEQPDDQLEEMDVSDPEAFGENDNSGDQNGRRLRRLKHASDNDSDFDDSHRDNDDGSDGVNKHKSVRDIASEAAARRLQEEEDRRSAVSLQSNVDSDVLVATEISSPGSTSRTGLGVENTELSTRTGKARVPADARRKAAGLSAVAQTVTVGKKSTSEMDMKIEPAGSAARGEKADVGVKIDLTNTTGNENTEIELEIDLNDLDPGASGGGGGGDGSGGRSALMELFASAGVSKGIGGSGAVGGDHDSDEDYEGFEDVQEEDEEEDEVRQVRNSFTGLKCITLV